MVMIRRKPQERRLRLETARDHLRVEEQHRLGRRGKAMEVEVDDDQRGHGIQRIAERRFLKMRIALMLNPVIAPPPIWIRARGPILPRYDVQTIPRYKCRHHSDTRNVVRSHDQRPVVVDVFLRGMAPEVSFGRARWNDLDRMVK